MSKHRNREYTFKATIMGIQWDKTWPLSEMSWCHCPILWCHMFRKKKKKTTVIADLSHGKTPTIEQKLSAPCRTRMPGRVNLAPKEICKKNTSFPKICTTKSKWIPGFTVSHGFTAFYVTTKSTNLRHGLTKLHLSIYDSKWVAGVTAVWGLVFLYSKPTCSTCLMFFPGKSLKII